MILSQWRIVLFVALLLTIASSINLTLHYFSEDYVRAMMRVTARTSVLLFVLAFSASSFHSLMKSKYSHWVLANRRYLGLSFALSQFVHLGFIILLANAFPERMIRELDLLVVIAGSLGYLFLLAMTVTSFAKPRSWLGEQKWQRLHLIGGYLLWYIFMHTYLPMAIKNPQYLVVVTLLVMSLGLRLFTAWTANTNRASQEEK